MPRACLKASQALDSCTLQRKPTMPPFRRLILLFPAASNGEFNLPHRGLRLSSIVVPVTSCGTRTGVVSSTFRWDGDQHWSGHAQPVLWSTRSVKRLNSVAAISPTSRPIHLPSGRKDCMRFVTRDGSRCDSARPVPRRRTTACEHCTGRDRADRQILKFEGAYHGSHADRHNQPISSRSASLPAWLQADFGCHGSVDESREVLTAPFNDG